MKELELLQWFETSAKPFLERHASNRLSPLISDCERLEKLIAAPDKITVCFLGNSGIGKSTLLNALAAGAEQILPAGGIGPLTAQATEVHYSEIPTFKVVYHEKRHLRSVVSSLEQRLLHQQRAEKKVHGQLDELPDAEIVSDLVEHLDEEDRAEILNVANSGELEEVRDDKLAANIKQAKQIITGNQFGECTLPYLVDALRLACEYKQKWEQTIKEAVDELRDTVKSRLLDEIRKPIKQSCEKFVCDGNDEGPGVKYRIIDLFRTLAANATKAAQQPAVRILQKNFSEVRGEIQTAFQQGGDPIQSTADLIVESHEARIRRSDAQRRGRVLGELETIFACSPVREARVSEMIDYPIKRASL